MVRGNETLESPFLKGKKKTASLQCEKKPLDATVSVVQLSASASTTLFCFLNSLCHYRSVQPGVFISCFPFFPCLCVIVIPFFFFFFAATGFITKCLSMCTFHTMLDRVARGHKLFVLQSDWSDTHILIPTNESHPLKAARPSELLGKNSSIKHALNLYRPSMKCCLSQVSCLRQVQRNWCLYALCTVPLYCNVLLTVWKCGETYERNTDPIFILQKRAIRIVNKATNRPPTNPLLVKPKALKFQDLINIKIAQTTYKVNNKQLPDIIQGLFQLRDDKYDLRGTCIFKRTNNKQHGITTKEVNVRGEKY